jgi:hypothetical protein
MSGLILSRKILTVFAETSLIGTNGTSASFTYLQMTPPGLQYQTSCLCDISLAISKVIFSAPENKFVLTRNIMRNILSPPSNLV